MGMPKRILGFRVKYFAVWVVLFGAGAGVKNIASRPLYSRGGKDMIFQYHFVEVDWAVVWTALKFKFRILRSFSVWVAILR